MVRRPAPGNWWHNRLTQLSAEPNTRSNKIAALEPVSHTLKAEAKRAPHLDLIAQDAEIVYPEVVHGRGNAVRSSDYAALVALVNRGVHLPICKRRTPTYD